MNTNLYAKEQSLLARARKQGPRKREPILREAVKVKCKIIRAECRAEKRSAA